MPRSLFTNAIDPRIHPARRKFLIIDVFKILAAGLFSAGASAHIVSEEDHHAFEHKYADMCVKKEKAKPTSVITNDDSSIIEMCECIAKEESKRLTSAEVRKFLRENKYPISLLIKAGQAENFCYQKLQKR